MKSIFVTPFNYSKLLSHADVEALIASYILAGLIPITYDTINPLVNFLASEDVKFTEENCIIQCAWHSSAIVRAAKTFYVTYTISVNPASDSACQFACTIFNNQFFPSVSSATILLGTPNGNYVADVMATWLAHEMGEAITDAGVGWMTTTGEENADLCAYNMLDRYTVPSPVGLINNANAKVGSRNYLIQSNWVNIGGGCCAMSFPFPQGCPYSTCC